MRTQDRLTKLLNILSSDYPKAWKFAEECRRDRGTDLPDWPEWCFFCQWLVGMPQCAMK